MKDEFVAWLNGRPVTRGELRAAFDLVADPTDWKNPINAVVDPDEQTKVCRRRIFFQPIGRAGYVHVRATHSKKGACLQFKPNAVIQRAACSAEFCRWGCAAAEQRARIGAEV